MDLHTGMDSEALGKMTLRHVNSSVLPESGM